MVSARSVRWVVPLVLVLALSATATLAVVAPVRPAGGDTVSNLRQQAATVAQQLVREQLQVEAARQQYSVLTADAASAVASVAHVELEIAADQGRLTVATLAVRHQALTEYMDAGTVATGSDALLFAGNATSQQDRAEYETVAAGSITTALDRLRTAQGVLAGNEAALRRGEQRVESAVAHQATVLAQATAYERQLAASQAEVTGQLAVAVAQQAAAQRAAAAAAIRAAEIAAVHAVSAPPRAPAATSAAQAPQSSPSPATPSTPAAASGGGAVSDPALNPFLRCVVQAESGGNYGAVSPNGVYRGAFQFSQATWNAAALAAGLPALVGVPPNLASKADQDTLAVALYAMDGEQPWVDSCRN